MFRGMYRGSGQGGGSGGDQHNLGWYATQSALETAHPTAEAGDWAIVGSTDTVWIWDTDTNAWKDSDQKGQVASVNGQTGTVVLTASDVGAATAAQGAKADTAVQPADLATVATTGDYDDLTNKPTIPAAQVNSDWNASSGVAQILNKPTLGTAASADTTDFATAAQGAKADTAVQPADLATVATTGAYSDLSGTPTIPDPTQVSTLPTASATEEGKIYQFIGTTTASYTNGYFYKCVSDGATPAVYSWERVDVQPAPVIPDPLPSQTGQSGKFLTTNGTDASWSNTPLVNNNTTSGGWTIAVGPSTTASGSSTIIIGANGYGNDAYACTGIGSLTEFGFGTQFATALGNYLRVTASYAIQLGASGSQVTNSDANTFKVANQNGNFEIMSADGTIPSDRLKNAINKYSTMPTASADNLGWIVQFTGTTDSTYTHGHLYECVSDGADPATYSWTAVEVQASSGGGSSYTAGTGIDITNDVISVTAPTLQNTANEAGYLSVFGNNSGHGVGICGDVSSGNLGGVAIGGGTTNYHASASGSYGAVAIGRGAIADGSGSVAIGRETRASGSMGVALGYLAQCSGSYAIQLGYGTNSTANTFSVGLDVNKNYQLLASDGTIPAARHAALPSADGTYVLKLVIANGVPTLSWVAE